MTPFEQAWSLLKQEQSPYERAINFVSPIPEWVRIRNERAKLRDATVAARRQGRQVPEAGMFRLDGSPRIGGQQNRLMNYPGQMFQPRPSDTYRSRVPETGPVQSEAMDPEAVRAMGSRIQTFEQSNAQREGMEDADYAYQMGAFQEPQKVKFEDLVDMPTSHQLAEMRAEATQRAMQKPYRQLNDYERKLVPVPEGLGTLYG